MTHDFHAYPREDMLRARVLRARLERLEQHAAGRCGDFIGAHRTALALSFGKDSMTVLHVLHTAGLLERCAVVMWNGAGMDTPDTLAMRDYVVARYSLSNFVETQPDADTLARTLALIDLGASHPCRDYVYECLERPRWRVMNERNVDGTILGLRRDESARRALHIRMRGDWYWNRREKADILLPLAQWTTPEVFAYAALRDVPLHPIYHHMPALGFDRMRVRLNSPVDLTGSERGEMMALRRLYPETFRRYAEAVPAITTLA